jgi:8-amino-7-oxononanoate synthase
LEATAAALVNAPSALAFSSGYAANVGLLSAVVAPSDVVVSDELNHASIIDGIRLSRARVVVAAHLDLESVRRALRAPRPGPGRPWVVTESYFSMDADSPDLRALRELCDEEGAGLFVDEAHALGILGPDGKGLCVGSGVTPDALVGTFGKAFGAAGAFVAGCEDLVHWLWNRARPFVFSTGMSPATAVAAQIAVRKAMTFTPARIRVHAAADQLRRGMRELGLDIRGYGPVIPWVIGPAAAAVRIATDLRTRGFHVQAIRPPSVPAGTARLRLTVTARHSDSDIAALLAAIREVAR